MTSNYDILGFVLIFVCGVMLFLAGYVAGYAQAIPVPITKDTIIVR